MSPGIDRTKRVKDARSEAQKEVEEYRKAKEEEFKKFESEVIYHILASKHISIDNSKHSSGNKKAGEDADKDAEIKLKEIKIAGSKGGDGVVQELIRVVTEVKPEVPQRISAQA